jgi:hypothetical protein
MLQFDELEHNLLTGNGIPPPSNLWRKRIYCQMALTIAVGPTGKAVHMELPICIVKGDHGMFPIEDRNYLATWKN